MRRHGGRFVELIGVVALLVLAWNALAVLVGGDSWPLVGAGSAAAGVEDAGPATDWREVSASLGRTAPGMLLALFLVGVLERKRESRTSWLLTTGVVVPAGAIGLLVGGAGALGWVALGGFLALVLLAVGSAVGSAIGWASTPPDAEVLG